MPAEPPNHVAGEQETWSLCICHACNWRMASEQEDLSCEQCGEPRSSIETVEVVPLSRATQAEQRVEELQRALVEAAIPLEVLHGQGSLWRPMARSRYRKVVSEGLRDQIAKSVLAARNALDKERDE